MVSSWIKSLSKPAEERRPLFERLVRESSRSLYNMGYRLTGNANEAEDLVQDTLIRAWRFFGRYDANLPFTSWAYRIMGNVHIDTIRKRGRLSTYSLDQGGAEGNQAYEVADSTYSPDIDLMKGELEEPFQTGLKAMTPEFRMAVVLADVDGMSYEEVAEVMGTSVGTVRSRIHRGRKQLRDHLLRHAPALFEVARG